MTNHNGSNLNIGRIAMWAAVLLAVLYIVYNGYVFFTCEACWNGATFRCTPPPCS
jgi:hypothetical protein